MATPEARIVAALRRANEGVAIGVGVALLGACAYTLADVIGRPLGLAPGGNEEIAGYVMAGATSWGMAYGLLALAHVRIDFVRMRAARPGRAALDLLAMLALTATTLLIAAHAWPVVAKTLANDSRANTALETPLWIPQMVWWTGWLWFAACAAILTLSAIAAMLRRDLAGADAMIGARDETGGEAGAENGGAA